MQRKKHLGDSLLIDVARMFTHGAPLVTPFYITNGLGTARPKSPIGIDTI